ncbi:hypothetical protein [Methylobacterium aerolatum]|uniref:Uncharacterized protein n=1 Tax=Methylobacterium aerolatum TaxID=418708 RepID=A0ABU0I0J0_9HYPH|nr:hypothetical protein [Methylobacterium aerolatum]MDQ0448118.1 hypothetical protein [Methylobacterium aerolatum]GJD34013.1 hypothetical protein FMGBMHLM_0909 [Methylobacterium aerolatum]
MNDALKPPGRLCDACAGSALTRPPSHTEDPARHVGELFRRLTLASETYPGEAFTRIVTAMLVAMGRACLMEAEAQALWLRERAEPGQPGIRVSATARRVDFDAWDPGDPA